MSAGADSEISTAPESQATSTPTTARKPRFALFVATACGLGYLPKAPGTWGSVGGLLIALAPWWVLNGVAAATIIAMRGDGSLFSRWGHSDPFLIMQVALAVVLAVVGVWSADR